MFFPRHAPASSRTSFSNISPGTKFAGQVNQLQSLEQLNEQKIRMDGFRKR
jgi:hypothetical protein